MRLTRIDDALEKFFSQVNLEQLSNEDVVTPEALRRVLAEDIVAKDDLPNFDRSAVDGYAIRAEDTYGALTTSPIIFKVVGAVELGSIPEIAVEQQQAVKILTGAAIPQGVNAVVMLEYTEAIGENKVEIYASVTPGENISKSGEDVKKGEKILSKGTVLKSQEIGILAALGISKVGVVVKPRIAVISTGNELLDLGKPHELFRIFDSNRPILMAMVKEFGGEPVDCGIAKDDLMEIRLRIANAIKVSDAVLVSGGSSVGSKDLVPEAINSLGRPGVIIHGMCMRPGRPTALAAIDTKPIILLPGFSVAAMISFNVFVKPILGKMLGVMWKEFNGQMVQARLSRRVPSSLGSKTFARVLVKRYAGGYLAEPVRTRGSGIISSMIRANGLVVIPEDTEGLEEGEIVEVSLFKPVRE